MIEFGMADASHYTNKLSANQCVRVYEYVLQTANIKAVILFKELKLFCFVFVSAVVAVAAAFIFCIYFV